jgi:hypothetical protein
MNPKEQLTGGASQRELECDEAARNEAPIRPYFLTQEQVMDLDFSCLPAALCWASYSTNNWALDLAAKVVDPAAWMGEEQRKNGKADDLSRALLIANCCRPLEAAEVGISAAKYDATLSRGVWSHGLISRAVVCIESRPRYGKVLHLCIRGTDFDHHPRRLVAVIQGIVGYFIWTYVRIEKHAFGFEPLAKALSAYASDSTNEIVEVVLSGHSLGGAAAQSLMPSFADCSREVHLVTFGSPGSGSGWLGPISYFNRVSRKVLRIALQRLARLTQWLPSLSSWIRRSARYFMNPLPSQMGKRFHYKHPNDPVAKYATTIYRRTGSVVTALSSLEIPTDGSHTLSLNIAGIGAHACAKYFQRIHDMLDRALGDVAPHAEPTLARRRLAAARAEGCRLEEQTVPEQMNERVKIARQANRLSLRVLPDSTEAILRLTKLQSPTASVSKIRGGRALRKLTAKLTESD